MKRIRLFGHDLALAFIGALAGIAAMSLAAIILSIIAATTGFVPPTNPSQVLTPRAQAHVAEQAAVTPDPACHPAIPAKAGVCAANPAVQAASVTAPLGNSVTVGAHGSEERKGALAFLSPSTAVASGPVDRGEDVSSYQGCSIDWGQRKRYLSFAVFKDDEGGSYHDGCFAHNVRSARQAGLPYGSYLFDRTNVSPESEADRQARDDRAAGYDPNANGTLPSTIDAETNDAGLSPSGVCDHVVRYIKRYERDTHSSRMLLYTSQGTWFGLGFGCPLLPPHTALWDAAYGPHWNNVAGLGAIIWQHSDGTYGPTPHLDGGDSDIWLGSHAAFVSYLGAQPQPQPIAYPYWQACSQLDAITWFRLHSKQHSTSPQQHAQAVAIRKRLARAQIGCSAMPHSYPYHLPKRKGALA